VNLPDFASRATSSLPILPGALVTSTRVALQAERVQRISTKGASHVHNRCRTSVSRAIVFPVRE
jgi:hypothetical protein